MKRRPLRVLLRAERRVAAKLRGSPLHRAAHRFRQPPDQQAREESRMRLFLRGFSQKPGGGWIVQAAKWMRYEAPPELQWSLVAVGSIVLAILIPKSVFLWAAPILGIGFQQLNRGTAGKDPNADDGRDVLGKVAQNYLLTMVMAGTLNAGWFAKDPQTGADLGLTKEQIITAAYNDATYGAIATGLNPWLPKSLLPYDITQTPVAANPTIHPTREGGNPSLDVWDVKAFGAAGIGSGDDYDEVQGAVSAAGASTGIGAIRKVWFSPGNYPTSQPVWVGAHGIHLVSNATGIETGFVATNEGQANLHGTYGAGPLTLVANSGSTALGIVSGLIGGGNAWSNTTDATPWRLEVPSLYRLDGTSALCVEAFYKSTYRASAPAAIVTCQGRTYLGDSSVITFTLENYLGQASFLLNIAGTQRRVADPTTALTDGNPHHIAGTYDGTTLRVFLDGTLVGSGVFAGTITQLRGRQGVVIGAPLTLLPDGGPANAGPHGTVDSVRIRNVVGYTTNFTPPTAKHTPDANTLALANWDTQRGPMSKIYIGASGTGWMVQGLRANSPTDLYGFRASGLQLSGAGLIGIQLLQNTQFFSVDHCQFLDLWNGIYSIGGNAFQFAINTSQFFPLNGGTCSQFAIAGNPNFNIGSIRDVWIWSGYDIPILLTGGAVSMDDVYITTNSLNPVVIPLALNTNASSTQPYTLRNVNVDVESGTTSYLRCAVAFAGGTASGLVADSCAWGTRSTSPYLLAGPSGIGRFTGVDFYGTNASGSVAVVTGSLLAPLKFDSCAQGTWQPWSNVAGTAIVEKIGPKTVTFSTTPTFDCSLGDCFSLSTTVTAAITATTVSNVTPGQRITFFFVQDGVGGHAVAAPSNFKGTWTVDTTIAHWTIIEAEVRNDGNLYWLNTQSGA